MPPPVIVEPSQIDWDKIVADKEAIREVLLHRYEMEQLDAICVVDPSQHLVAGYKDIRPDEFWVRGHFPNYPLLPGVLMCEAAAQLVSYYCISQKIVADQWLGFGGMNNVRFRGPVRPGDRLYLIGKATRLRRRQITSDVQGFVGSNMVFNGEVIGVPISPGEES